MEIRSSYGELVKGVGVGFKGRVSKNKKTNMKKVVKKAVKKAVAKKVLKKVAKKK